MAERVKVAVLQMTSRSDVEQNMQTLERLTTRAAKDGAKLVVAPECFAVLGPDNEKLKIAEPLPEGGPILARCQKLARELKIELVLGGFWEKGEQPGSCGTPASSSGPRAP
jgi:predicted amidohydrolase